MPTEDQVRRALELIGEDSSREAYFFSQLSDPRWVAPLRSSGVFEDPPPLPTGAGEFIAAWAPSQYLVRVAAETPDEVIGVILDYFRDTTNFMVQTDALHSALAMPSEHAVKVVPLATKWLSHAKWDLLQDYGARLVLKLAEDGYPHEALRLFLALMRLRPDDPSKYRNRLSGSEILEHEVEAEEAIEDDVSAGFHALPHPQSDLSPFEYDRYLTMCVPPLTDAIPIEAMDATLDLLETAIRYSSHDEATFDDYSYVWFPAFDSPEGETPHDLDSALANSALSAVTKVLESRQADVREIYDRLQERRWLVFRRLAIHVVDRFGDSNPELQEEVMLNHSFRDDYRFTHEYRLLIRSHFKSASARGKRSILDWMRQRPTLDQARDRISANTGGEPTEEEIKRWILGRRLNRLSILGEQLPEDLAQEYAEAVAEIGESTAGDFLYTTKSWAGDASPLSATEIREMSDSDLIEFLSTWSPTPEEESAFPLVSFGGLRAQLTEATKAEPPRFCRLAPKLKGLNDELMWGLIDGFVQALDETRPFEWDGPLQLLADSFTQPEGAEQQSDRMRESKMSALRLLDKGLVSGPNRLGVSHESRIWQLIEVLADDSDPPLDGSGDPYDEPLMASLNTIRSSAISTAIRFAVWKYQAATDQTRESISVISDNEALDILLRRHLDSDRDRSAAVRAAYGRWFNALLAVDRAWTAEQHTELLGDNPLGREAWKAYLESSPPTLGGFDLLRDVYSRSLNDLDALGEPEDGGHGPRARLIQHIATLYWHGCIGLQEEGNLLANLVAVGTGRDRREILTFIGRSLHAATEPINLDTKTRLVELWDWRRSSFDETAASEDDRQEIAGFLGWAASGEFDSVWVLDNLNFVLSNCNNVPTDFSRQLTERLDQLANTFPYECVLALGLLLEKSVDRWLPHLVRDSTESILRKAIVSESVPAKRYAAGLIERLFDEKWFDLKALLPR